MSFPLSALKSALVCLALAFFVFAGNAEAQITCPYTLPDSPTDEDILKLFYCATGGSDTSTTGWKTNNWGSGTLNTWNGVTASSGQVSQLNLRDYNLSGAIPSELGSLSNLTYLNLSANPGLSGSIPSELGSLSNLTYLNLSGNTVLVRSMLSGSIPPELGNLTSLTELYLNNNRLSGAIPPELGKLSKLTRLRLNYNQLSGAIPSQLGNLSSLTELNLNNNRLSGAIPSNLGNLGSLTSLKLDNNNLSGAIPSQLGNLSSLIELNLDNNRLSGAIPSNLGSLSNLSTLRLNDNNLGGAIPSQLGDLSKLTNLLLYRNRLSGAIPSDLGKLSRLGVLQLNNNQLSGAIPTELGDLSSLRILHLNNNQLSEAIPSNLENLSSLTNLDLSYNQLSEAIPAIPSQPGKLSSLTELKLNNNKLSGAIPPELGSLTNLFYLYLNDNQLSGAIPSQFESLTNLYVLYLHRNQLSGAIPTQLGSLTNLFYLILHQNQLSGAIPTQLGSLTNLLYLYLNDNQLSGAIPTQLGSLANLQRLYLHRNQLSGAIPSDLGSLANLQHLYLHDNQLSGTIPTHLGSLAYLQELGFWGNSQLTWTGISTALGQKVDRAALRGLYEENNGGNWRNKKNWLSGNPVSSWQGVMTNDDGRVSELNLANNGLTGEITNALEALGGLRRLDLSYNRSLSGTLPARLPDVWLQPLVNNRYVHVDISCTRVSLPADPAFKQWIDNFDRVDFRQQPCPPPPSPPPPPPSPPPPPPPPPASIEDPEGVLHSTKENAEGNFPLAPVGEGSFSYGDRTIDISIERDEVPSSTSNPAIIVPPEILDRVEGITFELSEVSQENPPSGFRLGGLVAEIDLVGVTLSEGETVEVCLPSTGDEGQGLYHYDEVSGEWELIGSSLKTVGGVQMVCGETDALSLFGIFVPVIESAEGVSHSENAEDGFSLTPLGEGGYIVYGNRTVDLSVTGDVDPSSDDPAVIVPRNVLNRVREITFELSEVSPHTPPPGLRLEGFAVEVDLGVTLGAEEAVAVCLPSTGGDIYRYNEVSEEWELLESRPERVNGKDVVCAETDAVSLVGVFVVEETETGGCVIASANGERTVRWQGALFNLLLTISVLLLLPGMSKLGVYDRESESG